MVIWSGPTGYGSGRFVLTGSSTYLLRNRRSWIDSEMCEYIYGYSPSMVDLLPDTIGHKAYAVK